MKLRTFLTSIVAAIATPWRVIAPDKKSNRVRVFPKTGDELTGLVVSEDHFECLIGLRVPVEFEWDGQTYYNPWQNKWYGHFLNEPRLPVLLFIDPADLDASRSRKKFWKLV